MSEGLSALLNPMIFSDIHVAIGPTWLDDIGFVVGAYDGKKLYRMHPDGARKWAASFSTLEEVENMADVIQALRDTADCVEMIANVEPVGCA